MRDGSDWVGWAGAHHLSDGCCDGGFDAVLREVYATSQVTAPNGSSVKLHSHVGKAQKEAAVARKMQQAAQRQLQEVEMAKRHAAEMKNVMGPQPPARGSQSSRSSKRGPAPSPGRKIV